jgi:transcriptional regulator with XRE-family HTH domain
VTDYGDRYALAVASELRAERARTGVTLAQLVERTGVAQSTIQRYLNGKRDIPTPVFIDLCVALGVSPRVIFDRAYETIQ